MQTHSEIKLGPVLYAVNRKFRTDQTREAVLLKRMAALAAQQTAKSIQSSTSASQV